MSQIYRERGKEDVEFQKVPPFKIFDNVWYVGPGYVSCYLITTSAGLILIDASEEPAMVQHVADSIQKAGFNLGTSSTSSSATDISIIGAASTGCAN